MFSRVSIGADFSIANQLLQQIPANILTRQNKRVCKASSNASHTLVQRFYLFNTSSTVGSPSFFRSRYLPRAECSRNPLSTILFR